MPRRSGVQRGRGGGAVFGGFSGGLGWQTQMLFLAAATGATFSNTQCKKLVLKPSIVVNCPKTIALVPHYIVCSTNFKHKYSFNCCTSCSPNELRLATSWQAATGLKCIQVLCCPGSLFCWCFRCYCGRTTLTWLAFCFANKAKWASWRAAWQWKAMAAASHKSIGSVEKLQKITWYLRSLSTQ